MIDVQAGWFLSQAFIGQAGGDVSVHLTAGVDSFHGLTNAGVLGGALGWPWGGEGYAAAHHRYLDRRMQGALAEAQAGGGGAGGAAAAAAAAAVSEVGALADEVLAEAAAGLRRWQSMLDEFRWPMLPPVAGSVADGRGDRWVGDSLCEDFWAPAAGLTAVSPIMRAGLLATTATEEQGAPGGGRVDL